MKNICQALCLIIVAMALSVVPAHADIFYRGNNAIHSVRGLLVEVHHGHRMITVEEEFSKFTRSFYVPFKRIDHLKVGDEIRVYFRHGRREAFSVQKMTPLEYRREDQNKGYLLRSEPSED